jgi:hypothetical protein
MEQLPLAMDVFNKSELTGLILGTTSIIQRGDTIEDMIQQTMQSTLRSIAMHYDELRKNDVKIDREVNLLDDGKFVIVPDSLKIFKACEFVCVYPDTGKECGC